MKYFCLFAAFGFWISIAIKDVFYVCLFITGFSLFLMYRFKRKLIVIIWALFTVCFVVYINKPIEEPQPGQYMIQSLYMALKIQSILMSIKSVNLKK